MNLCLFIGKSLDQAELTQCLCVYVVDQPNHEDDQNCGVIRTESSGRWQNRDCSMALPYICKKRPNATLDPFTTGVCFYARFKNVLPNFSMTDFHLLY